MTRGKRTCKILKEIRQEIADRNEIAYVTSECHYQGECKGTCPKCEAELKYLENELNRRRQMGKAAVVAGISLGIAGSFASCNNTPKQSDVALIPEQEIIADTAIADTISMDTIPFIPKIEDLPLLDGIIKTEGFVIDADFENFDIESEDDYLRKNIVCSLLGEVEEDIIIPGGIGSESLPLFPGGEEALMKFLAENLKYPSIEASISGTVMVSFVVEIDGSLTNLKILRSLHPAFDAEVLRVVKLMPKWKAGEQYGKPVRSRYSMPVKFELNENND